MDEKALEGLRVLLASDEELRAENAITESIIQTPMFLTMDEFEDSVFAKVGRCDFVFVPCGLVHVCVVDREERTTGRPTLHHTPAPA